ATTSPPTASTPHTYAAAGTYTVTLIATDTGGNASSPVTASVSVPPPSIAYVGRVASATVSTPSTTTTLTSTRQVFAGDAVVVAGLLRSPNPTPPSPGAA